MVSQNAIGNTIADNDFSVNRSLAGTDVVTTIAHSDNTAVASNSALKLSVGGTTSTGDPYINWLITGSTTYSMGPDNSDSDTFKITNGATPSAGSTLWSLTTAGAVTHNSAYTFPTADGAIDQYLATNGAGTLSWTGGAAVAWTPTITFGGAAVDVTYSGSTAGWYIIYGALMYIYGRLLLTSKGTSNGVAHINTLPFTQVSDTPYTIGYTINLALPGAETQFLMNSPSGGTYIQLIGTGSGGVATVLTDAEFANNTDIMFSGWLRRYV